MRLAISAGRVRQKIVGHQVKRKERQSDDGHCSSSEERQPRGVFADRQGGDDGVQNGDDEERCFHPDRWDEDESGDDRTERGAGRVGERHRCCRAHLIAGSAFDGTADDGEKNARQNADRKHQTDRIDEHRLDFLSRGAKWRESAVAENQRGRCRSSDDRRVSIDVGKTTGDCRRNQGADPDPRQNDGQHHRERQTRGDDVEDHEAEPDHLERQQRESRGRGRDQQTYGVRRLAAALVAAARRGRRQKEASCGKTRRD